MVNLWEPFDSRGNELWGWEFAGGRPVSNLEPPITVSIQRRGFRLDYTDVLNGKRRLTRNHIAAPSKYFGVSSTVFEP